MLKYLTHKLKTQSINEENLPNEKVREIIFKLENKKPNLLMKKSTSSRWEFANGKSFQSLMEKTLNERKIKPGK